MSRKNEGIAAAIHSELSGDTAYQNSAYITQFLRAPGSKGLHTVLDFIEEKFRQSSLEDVHRVTYPSEEDGTEGLGFIGWDVSDAKLEMMEPFHKMITSYDQAPTSIQMWSSATPREGVTAELVDVGTGVDESCYTGLDVKGKIVLATGDNQAEGNTRAFHLAVEKHGAIGLITDNLPYPQPPLRTRENHPEAISFLRIRTKSDKGWAFVLSLPMGALLREQLKKGPVKMRANVDASYLDEQDWELVAEITGRELPEEEVWFALHCGGPKPGANCASGAALGVEIARSLKALVDRGEIPRPRRTIKFMMGVEGDGLNAYLQSKSDENIDVKAGFVFCSVGDDQCKTGASLLMYRTPESIPTYVNDVCEDAVERFSKDAFTPYSAERPDLKMIRFSVGPYTPMSDNSQLMQMKIPCPLFWSWPSRHFHTQLYTADTLDPKVLKRCGEVAAYSAYRIADAGWGDALQFAYIMRSKTLSRLRDVSSAAINAIAEEAAGADPDELAERYIDELTFTAERDIKSLETITDLVRGTDPEFLAVLLSVMEEVSEAAEAEAEAILRFKEMRGAQ